MKPHIGVDSQLIHSVLATAAHVHDAVILGDFLHGDETRVWDDSANQGKRQMLAYKAPRTKDFTNRRSSAHRLLSDRDHQRDQLFKIKNTAEGRAYLQRDEAAIRVHQDWLPGVREECASNFSELRISEHRRDASEHWSM